MVHKVPTFIHTPHLLLTPTPPCAHRLGEKSSDPLAMYKGDLCTINVNLAGLPAIVLPCGYSQPVRGAQWSPCCLGAGRVLCGTLAFHANPICCWLPIGLQVVRHNFDGTVHYNS